MLNTLTPTQRKVLLYVQSFVKENGFPPTLHEIKDEFGYSSANSSHQHLRLIARKGYISLPGGKKSRGIKLLRGIKK